MSNSPFTFRLRELKAGEVEMSMVLDGQPVVKPVNYRQLWCLVQDGIQMLHRWPLDKVTGQGQS
jgi:hypothetical protein